MASFSTHKKQSSYIFYFHPRWKNEWKPNAWTDKLCEELSSFQSGLYNRIFLPKYFPLTATKKMEFQLCERWHYPRHFIVAPSRHSFVACCKSTRRRAGEAFSFISKLLPLHLRWRMKNCFYSSAERNHMIWQAKRADMSDKMSTGRRTVWNVLKQTNHVKIKKLMNIWNGCKIFVECEKLNAFLKLHFSSTPHSFSRNMCFSSAPANVPFRA